MTLGEIVTGDSVYSTIMSVHNSIGCMPTHEFDSAKQKERLFHPLVRGSMFDVSALTEPQAGSDANSLKTCVRRDGDRYALNGIK